MKEKMKDKIEETINKSTTGIGAKVVDMSKRISVKKHKAAQQG